MENFEITKPGEYRTRNGSRVTVHEANGGGYFSVKGSVWKVFRGKFRPRGHNIWKSTGQCMAVGVHDLDVVGEWYTC